MHEDPIPSVHHLSCDLSITRLIRIPQVPAPQVKEIEDDTEPDENGDLNPGLRINLRKLFLHCFPSTKKNNPILNHWSLDFNPFLPVE
jgi:hypothetical protein